MDIDWRPKQLLPADLPAAASLQGRAFPDAAAIDEQHPYQFLAATNWAGNGAPSLENENPLDFIHLDNGSEQFLDPEETGSSPEHSSVNLHTRRVESGDFNVALSARMLASQFSGTLGGSIGVVGVMQAKDGAYYLATTIQDDGLNPPTLQGIDFARRMDEHVLALVSDTEWFDLRDAAVGPDTEKSY